MAKGRKRFNGYSHLTKKSIDDKNGHTRNIWVKASKDEGVSSKIKERNKKVKANIDGIK